MRTIASSFTKKFRTNKLVLGFVGIAATTVIGTAGVAAAQQMGGTGGLTPPSKAACSSFAKYGFANKGQCVSWWELHNNPASGYGGGNNNTVNANVNVDVNGNNNVINVALNYIFG